VKIVFSERAWDEYLYWQKQDRKLLERINNIIRETLREPFSGIGKPEPLRHGLSG
jgi:toxin YoeB